MLLARSLRFFHRKRRIWTWSDQIHSEKPLVVVFGWLGARPDLMTKYVELYHHDLGYDTIHFTPPVESIYTPEKAFDIAEKLALELNEKAGSRNFVFHTLSSNGYYNYLLLLNEFSQKYPHLMKQISAAVFDSAPSEVTHHTVHRAFLTIYPRSHYFAFFVGLFLRLHFARTNVAKAVKLLQDLSTNVHPITTKQFYLWSSEGDLYINPLFLVHHMEQQKARGVSVSSFDFIDSHHVQHFKLHPQHYRRLIQTFLETSEVIDDQIY